MSIVVSMLIGSKNSSRFLVNQSVRSILQNIGTKDYLLVIGIADHIPLKVYCMVNKLSKTNKKIIIIKKNCETFAKFTNYVFIEYGIKFKWFLITHDDIILKTKKFISIVEKSLKPLKENIGWISFTDDDYLNGHWAPSTRPGFHLDYIKNKAWEKQSLFQFHNLKKGWLKNPKKLQYDFPKAPVKCHAPFSHFILIESKKLEKIGLCEDWSVVSLLIDEDWGLSAMKKGFTNIWIPDIIYTHCRTNGSTRAGDLIKEHGKEVAELFKKKWGFGHAPRNAKDLKNIKKIIGKSNLAWSMDRKSFEWDYIKQKK